MIHTRQAIRLYRTSITRTPCIRYASTSASSKSSAAVTGVLAVTALGAAAIAHYYPSVFGLSSSPSSAQSSSNSNETFTVSTGSGSRRKQHQFDLLPTSAVNARLAEHEQTTSISSDRPGNPVTSWHRNWVASNEPCEDRSAVDVIPRATSARDLGLGWFSARSNKRQEEGGQDVVKPGEGGKDLVLFSIMDGHAGWATSELLSKVLHPTLALGLAGLQAGRLPGGGWLDRFKVWKETWTPENVAATLADSFVQLDTNLSQTPISLLPAYHAGKVDAATIASLTEAADNGACAISCLVDAEEGDLYVASTGDCRAVAGWEKDGVWRCDVLSEDQMGENPKEVARMQREHPGEEETVIMRGRVQGGLQPTRAFGDASYKWKKHEMDQLAPIMAAEGKQFRKQRPFNATPPYVTARPEVTHRKIRPDNGEKLRFVVMATDGLWDAMTSEESTLLLASYLSSQPSSPTPSSGTSSSLSTTTSGPTIVHKSLLPYQISLSPTSGNPSDRPYPAQDLPGTGSRAAGTWALRSDQNAATYLIRNSLGGGDEGKLREMLSLKGDVSRWFRDDVTVTVIFFDDERSN